MSLDGSCDKSEKPSKDSFIRLKSTVDDGTSRDVKKSAEERVKSNSIIISLSENPNTSIFTILEEGKSNDSRSPTSTTFNRVTQPLKNIFVKKSSSINSKNSTDPKQDEENGSTLPRENLRKFKVHNLREEFTSTNINNSSNNIDEENKIKDSLLQRLKNSTTDSDESKSGSRRILICLSCSLTFDDTSALIAHGSSLHGISLNAKEKELLGCKSINSMIQEHGEGQPGISFLEPINRQEDDDQDEDKKGNGEERDEEKGDKEHHHEKTNAFNVQVPIISGVVVTPTKTLTETIRDDDNDTANTIDDVIMDEHNSEEDKSTRNCTGSEIDPLESDIQAPSVSSVDQEALNIQTTEAEKSKDTATELKSQPTEESASVESPTKAIESVKTATAKTDQPSERTRPLQINRQNRPMATTSENLNNTVSMSIVNNVKTSTSMTDTMFGSSGSGVATVDPMFQMSLFQSRNSCKTLKCPRCNWHYKYRQTLDAHMKEKHSEDTSDCLYCNANQPHPRLSRGESYACGYKPFKCEVCNYSTTTKGNLSIHMQSDKHLYNVKTIQHHQQQKEKMNGQSGNTSNQPGASSIPARLLAEKQEQFQNLMQQARKRSTSDTDPSKRGLHQRSPPKARKGTREFSASPTSSTVRRAVFRCDLCNYETDNNRNLRIHMQSEKHAHNLTSIGNSTLKRLENLQNPSRPNSAVEEGGGNGVDDSNDSKNKDSAPSTNPLPEMGQNAPNPMTLYYYLAALQASIQSGQQEDVQDTPSSDKDEERENQQKQILAQQQQLLVAQQYQQLFAQLAGQGDMPGPAANPLFQQQMLLQQQIQLWRQLLAQGDGSRPSVNLAQIKNDLDGNITNSDNSGSTSTKFLFTCGICCNFSCNDLESLCSHVRLTRFPRNPLEEGEWVTKSPGDGYLCRICNYTTQLKTNFSLHCKTEKHTSKLQLINHIREGGEANEWKISYAIAGNNMNKVTCNGCRHSSTSTDKLRIHCSTDRHQGTLTMCHYLDTMLKEAELGKGLHTKADDISSHHLFCRPCSYQSKFVVEMIQHMQCQKHQVNVHQEQQRIGANLTDMVSAEPDRDNEDDIDTKNASEKENDTKDQAMNDTSTNDHVNEGQIHKCQYCNYETSEENRLRVHVLTQHSARPAIKCPMCPEFMNDTLQFQHHLIRVHKLATGSLETKETEQSVQNGADSGTSRTIGGTLKAIHVPCNVSEEPMEVNGESNRASSPKDSPSLEKENELKGFAEQCRQCGDTLTSPEKWQLHLEIHRIQASAAASATSSIRDDRTCDECHATFSSVNQLRQHLEAKHPDSGANHAETNQGNKQDLSSKMNDTPDDPFSDARQLLTAICNNAKFARTALNDYRFSDVWKTLDAPFTCSPCEETFVSRNDLLDHVMASPAHMGQNSVDSEQIEPSVSIGADGPARNEESCEDSFPVEGAVDSMVQPVNPVEEEFEEDLLEETGNNEENRSSENREKAKRWKEQQNNTETTNDQQYQQVSIDEDENKLVISENVESKQVKHTDVSPFHCNRCGKDFSNMWILKVHEKSVHNMEMSVEMLQEFVEGYSTWYWDCAKKDLEETRNAEPETVSQFGTASTTSNNPETNEISSKPELHTNNLASSGPSDLPPAGGEKGFQQAALQALMKNYPGMLGGFGGVNTGLDTQGQPSADEAQSKLQQQMLLQMFMNAQQQQHQQQPTPSQPPGSSQANASNIMNMLVDHIYGAAMHGATPGFMDPVGVISLLQQQQQQSRVPASGLNPYQLLAMRVMQQQQLQQLLMYPAMSGGATGMPFLPSLAENANQQQMLASFAASLLNPGATSSDVTGNIQNNTLSSALQAYQLQAAAAASIGEPRSGGKDPEQDSTKNARIGQRESSVINQPQSSAELPTKRPRTRITDDQLKILRANFDINTSPSEHQISEMAVKTNLPPKVIKHWFRNTLFKERQRSKDSPYNFNIPPMTSLDDVKTEPTSTDNVAEENPDIEAKVPNIKVEPEQNDVESRPREKEIQPMFHPNSNESQQKDELHGATPSANIPIPQAMSQSQAMQILRSLTEREAKSSIFANAMSLIPSVTTERDSNSPIGVQSHSDVPDHCNGSDINNATQLFRRETSSTDSYDYDRISNLSTADFSYPIGTPSHANLGSTISRRTPRTRFSDYQLKILQEFFDKNAYPKDEDLDKLSRVLDLSTRVIVVWFQNARQKARKSYEMQQSGMNAGPQTNGIPIAHNNYSRKRTSPPLQSPSEQQSAIRPAKVEPDVSIMHSSDRRYSHEPAQRTTVDERNAVHDVKYENQPHEKDAKEASQYICRQCDATLPSAESLSQHEKLHDIKPSTYIESVIQQYRMFYPSIIEGMMQGTSNKDSHVANLEKDVETGFRRPSHSPPSNVEQNMQKLPYEKEAELTSHIKRDEGYSIKDVISRFTIPQPRFETREKSHSYEAKHVAGNNLLSQNAISSQQYIAQRDNVMAAKRKLSISPTLSMSSSSSTSPNSARQSMGRKVINDTSKDPKRLRTTITPEQLEFLYQQYLVDSSPSRKVIEQISDIVGLKKRVVQVWFQNTRARERKGQFRSVGRITSALGMPQICPHCRVTFRTKADLDAHVRYRHMQSPSSVTSSSVPQAQITSPTVSLPETKPLATISNNNNRPPSSELPSSRSPPSVSLFRSGETIRKPSQDKIQDYRDIINNLQKQMNEKYIADHNSASMLHGSATTNPIASQLSQGQSAFINLPFSNSSSKINTSQAEQSENTTNHPSIPKRRKLSNESVAMNQLVTSSMTSQSLAQPVGHTTEQMYETKGSSVDVIAQRLQAKTASLAMEAGRNEDSDGRYTASMPMMQVGVPVSLNSSMMSKHNSENPLSSSSPPVSSPESQPAGSTSPSFMVPLKRYRTQMSSLQVRSLKHCFSEYKTPTLLECEMLGQQIGLPKRVIQVWFQNARAKEKKAKLDRGDQSDELSPEQMKSSCRLCPEMRFGSFQEYRNHVFSKMHLQNFMNAYDGEGSDDQSHSSGGRSPFSDTDYGQSRDVISPSSQDNNVQHKFGSVPITTSDVIENKYRISAVATSNTGSSVPDARSQTSPTGWDASVLATNPALLQNYQQLAAVQKLMSASAAVQNGVAKTPESAQINNDLLNTLKQNWLQQTLMNSRMAPSESTPNTFEGINVQQKARTEVGDTE